MHTSPRVSSRALTRSAAALAVAALVAACGGGDVDPPPDTVPPTVAITDDVSAATAGGVVTFTFTFSEDVGESFVAEDVLVTGGTAGTLTKVSDTVYTLAVTPPADTAGTISVSVAAAKFRDLANNDNVAEATATQAFDTQTAPPSGGTVLANFDDVSPPVAGFEGAEGSAVEAGPAGGGSGNSFKVLRSGGQVYALGIIETAVPVSDTRRTISAQVYSPTAGIPMVLKIEGPDGANSGDVQANETVVQGWQTLTWTFTGTDVSKTYNKIVLLPNLGTVDAPPGQAYFFDAITLLDAAAPPVAEGTVIANFEDVSPPVAGFEGAEGSAIEAGPAGGGSGNSFKVLRSGGQVYALGIIETTVPVAADRRTISAEVYSPTAGIPMVLKLEGPDGANSGDTQANETVVQGWQTLTWTFSGLDVSKTYNKIVLLPNLGTVDAPPGQAYYFDTITLLAAAGGGGGGAGPLVFSSGFAGGARTVEGGEYGGFSGSNLDNFGCNGAPENCGGGGDVSPNVAAADSYFFYYYQTPTPASALYAGIYVQAPGVTGGLSASADTPGMQLNGQTQIKFNFNPNPEWYGTTTNNFMVQFDMGKLYTVNGNPCHIQLRKVVTPTSADSAAYALNLSEFAVVQNCGVAGLTATSVLASEPVSQVSFQAAGGGAAVSDGTMNTGANLSAANGAGVYPTTLVIKGGIRFE
ncbi:Ig-like domain-containing protein [Rubrivivax albus]|uniref:Bacterial Ig-like domain-containing protein n=1 Tax=Rubrivivax albus TaxID=2499835 RepID=A0A3S2TJ48_9BURK|nr:Ig-like domain-containing protein [Rubrivivax albus]RVT48434.1 hypothetical protein ENE75_22335 [Rubrivivax albus]